MVDIIVVLEVLILLVLVITIANLRIVPQSKAYVMERLGVYGRTWHTGLHLKVPFVERRREDPIDLREQILVVGEAYNHNHYHQHNYCHI